jgi:molybdopterin-guanine dinucleotide biosynthesis protein A
MRCSAVLLAGGKSLRMGRDKALLEIDGERLWRRQLATLQKLSPEQLMLSGPRREGWSEDEIVSDEVVDAGPLAGVAAALQKCTTPHLVVLAVDLPKMTADFLRSLLALCAENRGAVARTTEGFEPLAAVYPVRCAALAAAALQSDNFSMQNFVREAMKLHLLVEHRISAVDAPLFTNLNTPAEL